MIYWFQAIALRTLLALVRPMPLAWRQSIVARAARWVVRLVPGLYRRAADNFSKVFPEMPPEERHSRIMQVAENGGRTLTGIWFNADLARTSASVEVSGPGLAELHAAKQEGRPAIILSGHFGQWEAIRHVLRREGLETGALYRPNNNPYYEPIFRAGIEQGGQPIIPRGKPGFREMLRHLKAGGFMALLPDQAMHDGEVLDFLGHPARTSLAAADLALRFNAPLVPAFAPYIDGEPQITFEAAIPPSDAKTMMQDFNHRLASQVRAHPSQWLWFHRRWKTYG
jgi:KDO2-lipid IV(A) lauroyltransferase